MACFASDGISIEVYKRLRSQGVPSSIARRRASDVCEADTQTRLMAYTAQRERGLSSEAARRSIAHTSARQSLDLAAPNLFVEKSRLCDAARRAREMGDCTDVSDAVAQNAGSPKDNSWFSLDALLDAVRLPLRQLVDGAEVKTEMKGTGAEAGAATATAAAALRRRRAAACTNFVSASGGGAIADMRPGHGAAAHHGVKVGDVWRVPVAAHKTDASGGFADNGNDHNKRSAARQSSPPIQMGVLVARAGRPLLPKQLQPVRSVSPPPAPHLRLSPSSPPPPDRTREQRCTSPSARSHCVDHVLISVLRIDVLGTSGLVQSLAGRSVFVRATVLPVSGSGDATSDAQLSHAVAAGSASAADAMVVAKWVGASGCTQSGGTSSHGRCVSLRCLGGDDAIALEIWLKRGKIPFLGFGLASDELLGRVRLTLPRRSASTAGESELFKGTTRHKFTLELDPGERTYTGTDTGAERGILYLNCAMQTQMRGVDVPT